MLKIQIFYFKHQVHFPILLQFTMMRCNLTNLYWNLPWDCIGLLFTSVKSKPAVLILASVSKLKTKLTIIKNKSKCYFQIMNQSTGLWGRERWLRWYFRWTICLLILGVSNYGNLEDYVCKMKHNDKYKDN